MSRRSIVILSFGIGASVFLTLRSTRQGAITPSEKSPGKATLVDSGGRGLVAGLPAQGFDWAASAPHKKSDPEQFVSLSRMQTDADYVKRLIRRHISIKAYLSSPLKGNPEFEQVIDWLIGNGYAIEDVAQAWYALVIPASGMTSVEEVREHLRKKGKSQDQIDRSSDKILTAHQRQKRQIVSNWLHLEEDNTDILDSFLSMAPHNPTQRGPVDRFMPSTPPVEGERILRDEDWMSPERKALADTYRGPRRSTDSRDAWRPSPSPLSRPPGLGEEKAAVQVANGVTETERSAQTLTEGAGP